MSKAFPEEFTVYDFGQGANSHDLFIFCKIHTIGTALRMVVYWLDFESLF